MSDAAPTTPEPTQTFPPATMPGIYIDGIVNISDLGSVMKAYLFRNDPSLTGGPTARPTAIAQLIMTKETFIATALFLQSSLNDLVREGNIPQAMVDNIRSQMEIAQRRGAGNV
jgi:hypothetical protein